MCFMLFSTCCLLLLATRLRSVSVLDETLPPLPCLPALSNSVWDAFVIICCCCLATFVGSIPNAPHWLIPLLLLISTDAFLPSPCVESESVTMRSRFRKFVRSILMRSRSSSSCSSALSLKLLSISSLLSFRARLIMDSRTISAPSLIRLLLLKNSTTISSLSGFSRSSSPTPRRQLLCIKS
uniref:(northern house mosquito) hypothetical protein n=1 Tax=Culex pipiens TaxID=7175 RepID=A0A8D8NY80_CULPI